LTPGSRGKNPLGHYGDSENYFVVFDDELAYCHKRKALYNFVHFALCDAGVRGPNTSVEGQSLSEKEYFKLWEYAYEKGVVPEETPVPIAGLKWYAITNDFISAEDYAAHNDDDVEEGSSNSGLPLPTTIYRRVLKDIERQTGLEPPQLADRREQEHESNDEPGQEELPISRRQLSHEFAGYGEPEKAGDFLTQFSRGYLNVEQGEVTTDKEETMYVAVSDLRTVFNTIVEIIYQKHGRGIDNYPDGLGMEKRQQGAFAAQLKEHIEELSTDVEIKSARPWIGGERTRVWFGIDLTDRAQKLLQMADKVGEES